MNDPYENLANAIVLRAVEDWRDAVHRLKRRPKSETALRMKKECEEFFRSEWFTKLTPLDGEELLKRLMKEAEL